ncbi:MULTISPECIES: hypothetical protein [Cobetia]|nr:MULTISPECIES: hypothetical protein [Cobetia]
MEMSSSPACGWQEEGAKAVDVPPVGTARGSSLSCRHDVVMQEADHSMGK